MARYRKDIVRSDSYRTDFIRQNPGHGGLYMCVYCGKIIPKKHMEVDHVVAINLAQKSKKYRKLMPKEGINSNKNLVASCRRCNRRKSNKGGFWVVRGKFGKVVQVTSWVAFVPLSVVYSQWFLNGTAFDFWVDVFTRITI